MQFPLRTLVLLPVFVGLVLGYYLLLERSRIVDWGTAGQFWGRFARDGLLPVTATACIVGSYATLRREDRSIFAHGPRRLLLWAAVFLVPFVAGLNPAIGAWGAPDSRCVFRVFDVYSGILTYGPDPRDWITVGGHVAMTALQGLTALWICARLDAAGGNS
ncbi:MAG: hypothetical protein ACYC0X_24225 [Pirellulaceae bacterium]